MKIDIRIDEEAEELGISVVCKHLTPEIEKLLATLRMMNRQLTVKKGEDTYLLNMSEVFYIESVDRKCFIYTMKEVYESDFKLYELEAQLDECGFFRASKSCLIHLHSIQSLRADINRKIRVTMKNGEQIIVSRQYAEELKKRLGVK